MDGAEWTQGLLLLSLMSSSGPTSAMETDGGPAPRVTESTCSEQGPNVRTCGPARLRRPTTEKDFDKSAAADRLRGGQPTSHLNRYGLADMELDLARLESVRSHQDMERAARRHQVALEEWRREGRKWPIPTPYDPQKDRDEAIGHCQRSLLAGRDYPRRDEALLLLATLLEESGLTDQANDTLRELVQSVPDSDNARIACLRLGKAQRDVAPNCSRQGGPGEPVDTKGTTGASAPTPNH